MMNIPEDISPWLAIPVVLLLIGGSLITLIGTLGLLRLPHFYQRIHGPAISITFGAGSFLLASMLYFTVLQQRLVIHELLITAFVMLTAPVTAMLLMRTAVYRDLRNGRQSPDLKPPTPPASGHATTAGANSPGLMEETRDRNPE
ncbi:multisubunit potassium/proton antiporter, PhaG subunit [Rheinheimera pacifica]|uniref:Multisubunit potassium/proton antiporter, PhaG subunit n=1 Tax=Rheinheimera pacifica TaxID=173990 RepID=A0A1H6J8W4_9GAMM|nr:monovalent cation/H(+) antiporter subunit G [Rheinheimera pacifica]SEH58655.1 multisubunit potassium/proton antiporter, PhaG subunit [Rheinheimera pacifica]